MRLTWNFFQICDVINLENGFEFNRQKYITANIQLHNNTIIYEMSIYTNFFLYNFSAHTEKVIRIKIKK